MTAEEAAAAVARKLLTEDVVVVHGSPPHAQCPWCGAVTWEPSYGAPVVWTSRRENAEVPEGDGYTYVGCWRFVEAT